jgi:hypothetical protein
MKNQPTGIYIINQYSAGKLLIKSLSLKNRHAFHFAFQELIQRKTSPPLVHGNYYFLSPCLIYPLTQIGKRIKGQCVVISPNLSGHFVQYCTCNPETAVTLLLDFSDYLFRKGAGPYDQDRNGPPLFSKHPAIGISPKTAEKDKDEQASQKYPSAGQEDRKDKIKKSQKNGSATKGLDQADGHLYIAEPGPESIEIVVVKTQKADKNYQKQSGPQGQDIRCGNISTMTIGYNHNQGKEQKKAFATKKKQPSNGIFFPKNSDHKPAIRIMEQPINGVPVLS